MPPVHLYAPAKLNLFLAITGRRSDGFHNLVSLAVPLDFGDELELSEAQGGGTRLVVEHSVSAAETPGGADNLVLRAEAAFREASGFPRPVQFLLKKQIPVGAGLGGGSSDAVAALRGLNTLAAEAGCALPQKTLGEIAAKLGADCAFFAHGRPAVMRGRGELIEALSEAAARRLSTRELFVCKPEFGVSTAWAYGKMAVADKGQHYVAEGEAERLCRHWLAEGECPESPPELLTFNNMESVVFRKYPALPVLASAFLERFGLTLRMSGSGSACFTFLPEKSDSQDANAALKSQLSQCVCEFWGPSAFARTVRIRAAL